MSRAGLWLLLVASVGGASCLIANDFEKVGEGDGGSGASTSTSGGGSSTGGSGTGVGLGGTGGTGSGTGGTGVGAPDLCPDDTCLPACDDFEDANLDGWNEATAPPSGSIDYSDGQLIVTIDDAVNGNYAWYNDERGWRAWRAACGDFAMTVKVAVTAASGTGVPSASFNSGGLLVRSTDSVAPGDELWAMVNIGRQATSSELGVETKATQHSISDPIDFHDATGGLLEGEVGMCRYDDRLHLAVRPTGGEWQHLATYGPYMSQTPNGEVTLSDDVELGLVVNGYGAQDARVTFDDVTFWIPGSKEQCPGGGSND